MLVENASLERKRLQLLHSMGAVAKLRPAVGGKAFRQCYFPDRPAWAPEGAGDVPVGVDALEGTSFAEAAEVVPDDPGAVRALVPVVTPAQRAAARAAAEAVAAAAAKAERAKGCEAEAAKRKTKKAAKNRRRSAGQARRLGATRALSQAAAARAHPRGRTRAPARRRKRRPGRGMRANNRPCRLSGRRYCAPSLRRVGTAWRRRRHSSRAQGCVRRRAWKPCHRRWSGRWTGRWV